MFPSALLLDCETGPVPLHVVSAFADAKEKALKVKALAVGQPHWTWSTDTELPLLPARGRSRPWGTGRQLAEPGTCAGATALNSGQ